VCGAASAQDPTEPVHSGRTIPIPPVPDEPEIADLRSPVVGGRACTPRHLPLGVDLDAWLARAKTPWDAFPDTTGAKMDAESVGLAEALKHPNVDCVTGVTAERLERTRRAASCAV
jgi:hypothetical protein